MVDPVLALLLETAQVVDLDSDLRDDRHSFSAVEVLDCRISHRRAADLEEEDRDLVVGMDRVAAPAYHRHRAVQDHLDGYVQRHHVLAVDRPGQGLRLP